MSKSSGVRDRNQRPLLIPIGGFLGAGKTTLILAAAQRLQQRGLRVAAILNFGRK